MINMIGILDRIIRYDNWIGLDWMGLDGIGWDYWILYLDGFCFFPTLMGPAARRGIPRRGVFFLFYVILSKMVINCQKM